MWRQHVAADKHRLHVCSPVPQQHSSIVDAGQGAAARTEHHHTNTLFPGRSNGGDDTLLCSPADNVNTWEQEDGK